MEISKFILYNQMDECKRVLFASLFNSTWNVFALIPSIHSQHSLSQLNLCLHCLYTRTGFHYHLNQL